MKCCSVCGKTEKETRIIKRNEIYYCRKHYLQLYRHGKILTRTIYDENPCEILNGVAHIKLFSVNGKEVGELLVDEADAKEVLKYKWHVKRSRNTQYAMTHIGNKKVFIHTLITGEKGIDHVNGNGLDNRRCNLELVTHASNIRNQTPHKRSVGVKKVPSGKYQACIGHDYRTIYLGTFATKEEAQRVRNRKEQELRA